MYKNYLKSLLFIVLIISIQSCTEDDKSDDYIPIIIETSPDFAVVVENNAIEIDVLSNDSNVPISGSLVTSNSTNGTIEVLDTNNTPNNPSDDMVLYTPNTDFVGTDIFTYTICNNLNPTSCSTENVTITVTPVSPVNFNLDEIPYNTLSEYNFFKDSMSDLDPVYGVLPYKLISGLFIDYAQAKTFLWMPSNVKASYVNDYSVFDFPEGAILITTHYYENVLPEQNTKMIETRLLIKKEGEWIMANYVWNGEQSEASYTTEGSFVNVDWIDNNETKSVTYRIPSYNECFTCHNKYGVILPIGPKPQNLNRDLTYTDGTFNQLQKWIDVGYLESNLPTSIVSMVKWDDESLDLNLRVRSYLDINCSHCHSEEGYCDYRSMRFAFNENEDDTNKGVCVTPDTQISPLTHIIAKGQIDKSVLHFRISSTEEQNRMPLLGRTLQHTEGVRLIEEWINSLEGVCE